MSLKNQMSIIKNKSQLSLSSADSLTELSPETSDDSMKSLMGDDWTNRQFIEAVTTGIQKITEFLNNFDKSCKSKLAALNQRLTKMEKAITFLETYYSNPQSMDRLRESQKQEA